MRKIFLIIFFFLSINLIAQQEQFSSENDLEEEKVEMADVFREEGKIYVVVAILSTVFLGLIVYTILIDRKISRVEKEIEEKNDVISGN